MFHTLKILTQGKNETSWGLSHSTKVKLHLSIPVVEDKGKECFPLNIMEEIRQIPPRSKPSSDRLLKQKGKQESVEFP